MNMTDTAVTADFGDIGECMVYVKQSFQNISFSLNFNSLRKVLQVS